DIVATGDVRKGSRAVLHAGEQAAPRRMLNRLQKKSALRLTSTRYMAMLCEVHTTCRIHESWFGLFPQPANDHPSHAEPGRGGCVFSHVPTPAQSAAKARDLSRAVRCPLDIRTL